MLKTYNTLYSVPTVGEGRDSVVRIATRYGPDGSGFESLGGEIFPIRPDRTRVHPASCTKGTGSLSRRESGLGVALKTHPRLVPKLLPFRAFMAWYSANFM
jgi:hypothetical protein